MDTVLLTSIISPFTFFRRISFHPPPCLPVRMALNYTHSIQYYWSATFPSITSTTFHSNVGHQIPVKPSPIFALACFVPCGFNFPYLNPSHSPIHAPPFNYLVSCPLLRPSPFLSSP